MGHHSEVFIGIDTSKLRNAVAIAEAGRNGEVRYLGEIDTSEAATSKLVASLARKYAADVLLRGGADRLRSAPARSRASAIPASSWHRRWSQRRPAIG